jgi:hypothetical protein
MYRSVKMDISKKVCLPGFRVVANKKVGTGDCEEV